jgi:hypothetical protein
MTRNASKLHECYKRTNCINYVNAIVLSHFDYCSLVWGNCCEYLIDKLQKLQNRAARIITGSTYDVSSENVLKELNWQPLKNRYKNNKTSFLHKLRNDALPSSLTNMFKIANNDRYNLRSNDKTIHLKSRKQTLWKRALVTLLHHFGTACPLQLKKKALA